MIDCLMDYVIVSIFYGLDGWIGSAIDCFQCGLDEFMFFFYWLGTPLTMALIDCVG
jgi:hypothetical protein